MTVEAFADHIGTTRQTVHAIIAGRSAVREEMAVRLARAFKTTPQFWLNLQMNHVVWELERLQKLIRIRPVKGVVEGVVQDWGAGRAKSPRRSKGHN
jgi:addiction module HigA family antidote